MVRRFISSLSQEIRGVHQAAYLLAVFSFLAQLLAFVRDRAFAHMFGAGHVLDVYYAAFKIPDVMFAFLGSAVSISVLVPAIVERETALYAHGDRRCFVNSLFTVFVGVMAVATLMVWLIAPQLVHFLYPTLSAESTEQTVFLTRILLVQPLLLGVSSLLGSMAQARHRFVAYAAAPIAYNAGIIVTTAFGYDYFGITALGLGVVLGALLHVSLQATALRGVGVPWFTRTVDWKGIREVLAITVPRSASLSLSSVVFAGLTSLASRMPEGSIAVLTFAWNLQSVPLSLIAASYSVAAFPSLSRAFAQGNRALFSQEMTAALRHILLWAVPATALFIVLRAHVVRVVLGTGAFDWQDTRLTAACLGFFSISIAFQCAILLYARACHAARQSWVPFTGAIIGAVTGLVAAYVGMKAYGMFPLFAEMLNSIARVTTARGASVVVLPLGYIIGVMVQWGYVWHAVRSRQFVERHAVRAVLGKLVLAALTIAFVTYIMLNITSSFFVLDTLPMVLGHALLSGGVGIAMGGWLLFSLKSRELGDIVAVVTTWYRK